MKCTAVFVASLLTVSVPLSAVVTMEMVFVADPNNPSNTRDGDDNNTTLPT